MNITYSKCFIIVMVLSLSLQAKGFCPTPTPPPPTCAWYIVHKNNEERREQEQLNKLLNERIKQGKKIEITADKDVKLLIKQGKMADITVDNKEPGLKEYVFAAIVFYIVICLLYWWLTLIQKRW